MRVLRRFATVGIVFILSTSPTIAATAFQSWLETLWPQALSLGVKRATFDAATRGLEPDLSLPDLLIPGRSEKAPGQPEFVQTPSDYLKEGTLTRLAEQGRALFATHRATLAAIEHQFGVPGPILLAIWARETAYGTYKLPYNAIRALATEAYLGKRKEKFSEEFLLALKLLQDGDVGLADMRSSWAGAMGQTQFLPSEFFKYAVDFDGDGRRDIWNSVPDTLASAAKQLADKGWVPGQRWAFEVQAPKDTDCTLGVPDITASVGDWVQRGFVPVGPNKPDGHALTEQASLLQPQGSYGPAFLTLKNYYVIKEYNISDLYVLFVGNLSDRIAGGRAFATPWSQLAQMRTEQVEAMQRTLARRGIYAEKIDGKAGMKTRAALGAYQKASGLKVDCWPSQALLDHMRK